MGINQSQLFWKEGDSIKITREAEGNKTNIKLLNLLDHSVQVNPGRANLEKTCLVATPHHARKTEHWVTFSCAVEEIRRGKEKAKYHKYHKHHKYHKYQDGKWK